MVMAIYISVEESRDSYVVSAVDLSNAKFKIHLAFRPKNMLATGRLKLRNSKFFWHSAIVPSYK